MGQSPILLYHAAGYAVAFTADLTGPILRSVWDFGDGTVVTNQPYIRHAWTAPGPYTVRLTGYNDSHPEGVTASIAVEVVEAFHYVNLANQAPVFPYTSWATAATNIQDAVDAGSVPGRLVLVTNGVYQVGAIETNGLNRVVLRNGVVVRSVNGPELTAITGEQTDPETGQGPIVRCAYVETDSMLSGFTLTKGQAAFDWQNQMSRGGGAVCGPSGVVTNCILIGNSGSGVFGGTLHNCTLSGNTDDGAYCCTLYNSTISGNSGDGAFDCTLHNCTLSGNTGSGARWCSTLGNCALTGNTGWGADGAVDPGNGRGFGVSTLYNCTVTDNSGGGVQSGSLYNCTVTGNSGGGVGGGSLYNCTVTGNSGRYCGGVSGGTLYNCVLTGNSAAEAGGGASWSTLYNCTVTGNSARYGGGVAGGSIFNSIVYFNQAPNAANWSESGFDHSCTTPLPEGPGNIDADPRFVNADAGDFRLRYGSPCIDAGSPQHSTAEDLAGLPRPLDGNGDGLALADMGAYEFDLRTIVPTDWFTQQGLDVTDPHVVAGNPDQDGQTNFQEWLGGTDPREPLSFFRIEGFDLGPPVTVSYRSLTGRVYTLYGAPDLPTGAAGSILWSPLPGGTAVPGTGGLDSLTDTNASSRTFYRLGVNLP